MSIQERLGTALDEARSKTGLWKGILYGFLGVLLVANAFILPHHPHVNQEHYPGFWAVFSIVGGLGLIWLAKGFLTNVIGVSEDFYERDK
ncbi:MAG: hypothetical protein ACLFTB_03635 [Desulfovibrionales bacterium]